MQIPITEAIQQLRNDLRTAVLQGQDQEIVFTPNNVELELSVKFVAEAKTGGGFKLFAVLDLSAEGKTGRESEHKIKISFSVADAKGEPIKVISDDVPDDLP